MPTAGTIDSGEVRALLGASDAELWSVLGAQALPVVVSPGSLLDDGRRGVFWQSGPAILGGEPTFRHDQFQLVAKAFLSKWAAELHHAVCAGDDLDREIKKRGFKEVDVAVASIVGYLATSIPALAPFTGLLVVLGVMICRTGVKAFCATLVPSDKPSPAT